MILPLEAHSPILTIPTWFHSTVFHDSPASSVAAPVPVTEPAPAVCANETLSVLPAPDVTVLLFAS